MEQAPVGDHPAHGLVENVIKNVQGRFRVIKDALKSRHGRSVEVDHPAVPRMMMHAASVVNKGRKDDDCFTAYRRWRGRELTKAVAEFGECSVYTPALSVGKDKFDVGWKEGVWFVIKAESGEWLIGTGEGVAKARDFRRKPGNGRRWNKKDFDKFRGEVPRSKRRI